MWEKGKGVSVCVCLCARAAHAAQAHVRACANGAPSASSTGTYLQGCCLSFADVFLALSPRCLLTESFLSSLSDAPRHWPLSAGLLFFTLLSPLSTCSRSCANAWTSEPKIRPHKWARARVNAHAPSLRRRPGIPIQSHPPHPLPCASFWPPLFSTLPFSSPEIVRANFPLSPISTTHHTTSLPFAPSQNIH